MPGFYGTAMELRITAYGCGVAEFNIPAYTRDVPAIRQDTPLPAGRNIPMYVRYASK